MIANRKVPASNVLILLSMLLAVACSKPSLPTETTVGGATSTAPSTADAKQDQKTLLRFINATAGPKDLYFQDALAFRSVESADLTSYLALPSPHAEAQHELKLYDSASPFGKPLVSDSEPENIGHRYTVLALEKNGKFTLTLIPDQLKAPSAGKAKVREIHAAEGADYGRFTDYKEAVPGTKFGDTKLAAGKLYTIVSLGGGGKPVVTKVIEDELVR